jgi:hypothetical protein
MPKFFGKLLPFYIYIINDKDKKKSQSLSTFPIILRTLHDEGLIDTHIPFSMEESGHERSSFYFALESDDALSGHKKPAKPFFQYFVESGIPIPDDAMLKLLNLCERPGVHSVAYDRSYFRALLAFCLHEGVIISELVFAGSLRNYASGSPHARHVLGEVLALYTKQNPLLTNLRETCCLAIPSKIDDLCCLFQERGMD